jgi:hypothetical protein
MKSFVRVSLLPVLLLVLSACGGGGGGGGEGASGSGSGTLTISGQYASSNYLGLYTNGTITPQITGLQGHAPNCSVVSGGLPTGMHLNSDCSVSGIPLAVGAFSFTARLGASGVSNTLDFFGVINVTGPKPSYARGNFIDPALSLGYSFSDTPSLGWTAPTGLTTSYTYQVQSGQFPPGMSLDSRTGVVSGVPTTVGSYSATILLTLNTIYGTFTNTGNYTTTVTKPGLLYVNTGGTGNSGATFNAYYGQPFELQLDTPSEAVGNFNVQGATLPAGLTLNAATGKISGTIPTATPYSETAYTITGDISLNGVAFTASSQVKIAVTAPIYANYPSPYPRVSIGTPTSISPSIVQASGISAATATMQYALGSECTIAPGMVFNTSNGVFSGSPTAVGTYVCSVNVTTTYNGLSWTRTSVSLLTVQ